MTVCQRRKLDGDKFDWDWVTGRWSVGLYVKHLLLRLARPASEGSGGGQQGGELCKYANKCSNLAQVAHRFRRVLFIVHNRR